MLLLEIILFIIACFMVFEVAISILALYLCYCIIKFILDLFK